MPIAKNIVEGYYLDRAAAETADEKRAVWRMYARALIEEFQQPARRIHTLGAPVIVWRRASGDADLPVRFPPYWARIPLADLQELWLALERARHKAPDDD